ncbi:hypothetical protein BD779DRAFT_1470043 [Infundibulicybe gibba]|nr:hypothetical protein BD779DRAFT_1470043 [Infundibulicybe gibba]
MHKAGWCNRGKPGDMYGGHAKDKVVGRSEDISWGCAKIFANSPPMISQLRIRHPRCQWSTYLNPHQAQGRKNETSDVQTTTARSKPTPLRDHNHDHLWIGAQHTRSKTTGIVPMIHVAANGKRVLVLLSTIGRSHNTRPSVHNGCCEPRPKPKQSPGQPEAIAIASLSPPKPGLNRGFQAKPSRHITMSRSHPVRPHALMQIREVLAASHTREQLLTRIYRIVLVGSYALSRGYLTEPPHPRAVIRQRQSTCGTTPRGKRTRWGNPQHVDELRASKTPAVDPCGAYPYPSPLLL